jgi:beta-galactosidase
MHVDVYSACDAVELRLNGRTIGRHATSKASRYMATWMVAYEPGALEAIGYRKGKRVAHQTVRTAGPPSALRLSPDRATIRADGQDLSFVTVEVLDDRGMRHPNADTPIAFTVRGPGVIAGVGNGNPASLESFQAHRREAYNGRCLVVIKSQRGLPPGRIVLTARAKGLTPAVTVVQAKRRCAEERGPGGCSG